MKVSGSMSRKERAALKSSTYTTANGIPRLEADDVMKLRVLRPTLELAHRLRDSHSDSEGLEHVDEQQGND